jgi:hypothetical protein
MVKIPVFFPRCLECGGQIELVAREGRTYEIVKGHHLHIPSDFRIPTCTTCGNEIFTIEISEDLDKLFGIVYCADCCKPIYGKVIDEMCETCHAWNNRFDAGVIKDENE